MTEKLINAKENNVVLYPLSAGCNTPAFQHLITQKHHLVATPEKSSTRQAIFTDISVVIYK